MANLPKQMFGKMKTWNGYDEIFGFSIVLGGTEF